MLVQQLQKLFGNISGDITAEWWIKPYDVPTALLFRFVCDQRLVFQVDIIMVTLFQCILILSLRFIKNFFIRGIFRKSVADDFGKSVADYFGKLFYYLW